MTVVRGGGGAEPAQSGRAVKLVVAAGMTARLEKHGMYMGSV